MAENIATSVVENGYFEVAAQVFQHQCPDIVAKTHITGKQQHRAFCSHRYSSSSGCATVDAADTTVVMYPVNLPRHQLGVSGAHTVRSEKLAAVEIHGKHAHSFNVAPWQTGDTALRGGYEITPMAAISGLVRYSMPIIPAYICIPLLHKIGSIAFNLHMKRTECIDHIVIKADIDHRRLPTTQACLEFVVD